MSSEKNTTHTVGSVGESLDLSDASFESLWSSVFKLPSGADCGTDRFFSSPFIANCRVLISSSNCFGLQLSSGIY